MYGGSKIVILRDKNRAERLRRGVDSEQIIPSGPVLQRFDRLAVEAQFDGLNPETEVTVESTSPDIIEDISHDQNVVAVAEAMPISLIKTVDQNSLSPNEIHSNAADDSDVTWGIKAIGADNSLLDGSKTVVAVLDTGIDRTHSAFNDPNLTLIEKNFTTESDIDENGHGTHCAGTIFGRDVDGMRIGVAPGVKKAFIGKVIGSGAGTAALINALEWASTSGANIISMSLGFDFPQYQADLEAQGIPQKAATSLALQAYRNNLRLFDEWMSMNDARIDNGTGSVVIAAAGNESLRNASVPYEISTSSPASANDVVSVGALADGSDGLTVASFSNTGPQISAPGVSVKSAKLGGGLTALNGTSMACPHVAGIATLIWHDMMESPVRPTPTRVIGRLLSNAEHAGVFASNIDFSDVGVGLVQAP